MVWVYVFVEVQWPRRRKIHWNALTIGDWILLSGFVTNEVQGMLSSGISGHSKFRAMKTRMIRWFLLIIRLAIRSQTRRKAQPAAIAPPDQGHRSNSGVFFDL
jgi:hypothetical protein